MVVKTSGGKRGIIPEPPRQRCPLRLEAQPSGDHVDEPAATSRAVRSQGLPLRVSGHVQGHLAPAARFWPRSLLSKDQRATLFKAIVAARIFDLPAVTNASGGEPADNYELEVRNGKASHCVLEARLSGPDRLPPYCTILNMVNPRPGDGCVGGPPKVR